MKLPMTGSLALSCGMRVALTVFGAIAAGVIGAGGAAGQPYPSRPIKIISPFSPGSPPDAVGRLVAQKAAERLGQSIAIENRPGGGTTIATRAVATVEPDGYTLLQTNAALAFGSVLYPNAGYDPLKSFSPVATFAIWSHLLVVPANVQANTIEELVAYAKANPGQVNIGFPLGSPPQVLAEMLKSSATRPVQHRAISADIPAHGGSAERAYSGLLRRRGGACLTRSAGQAESARLYRHDSVRRTTARPYRHRGRVAATGPQPQRLDRRRCSRRHAKRRHRCAQRSDRSRPQGSGCPDRHRTTRRRGQDDVAT